MTKTVLTAAEAEAVITSAKDTIHAYTEFAEQVRKFAEYGAAPIAKRKLDEMLNELYDALDKALPKLPVESDENDV